MKLKNPKRRTNHRPIHKQFSVLEPKFLKKVLQSPLSEREELVERLKIAVHEQRGAILKQAFKEGRLTEVEYQQQYQDRFYNDWGMDSFMDYLNAAMNTKVDCFVTDNHRMLNVREDLERRFKLKIRPIQEVVEKSKENSMNTN